MNINNLFLWGSFPYKALSTTKSFPAAKFQFIESIQHVACGTQHILFASDRELYGIGSNQQGQLGLVDSRIVDESIRKLIFPDIKIKQIQCGDYFSVVLTEEGVVFCSGEGSFGTMGNSSTHNLNTFTKVLQGIIKISAGSRHILALNRYGMVYGWGDNQQGQLGSRSLGNIVLQPKLLKVKNVIEISANRNISIFLKDEQIYGCGGNDLGQLGLGHKSIVSQIQPIIISAQVAHICAGNYTYAQTTDGDYYFFGSGAFGQLLFPVKMDFPDVTDLYVGETYGLYKDIYHRIHGWGSNLQGQMGVSQPTRFFTPTLMPHLNKFTSFVCGKNFVIGLCNPQYSQDLSYDNNINVTLQSQRLKDHIVSLQAEITRLHYLLKQSKPQYYNVLKQLQSLKQQNLKLKQQLYLQKQFNEPKLLTQINRSEQQKQRLRTLLHQMSSASSDRQQMFLNSALDQQINYRRKIHQRDQSLLKAQSKYGDLLNRIQNSSFAEQIYGNDNRRQYIQDNNMNEIGKQKLSQLLKHTGTLRKIMQDIYKQSIQ